jgi:serine phosphatase RsbU (regulator of sigma subunit)
MDNIKKIFLKYRQKLIVAASTVILLVAVVNIYFNLYVDVNSNDECLWVPKEVSSDSIQVYFNLVKVGGVSWNAGIRDGDRLIAINGIKIRNEQQAQTILNKVSEGHYADYTVGRDGKIFETKVYVKKLVLIFNLSNSLRALFWMIIGFIVLLAKPEGFTQKLFYAIGVGSVFSAAIVFLNFEHTHQYSFGLFTIVTAYLVVLSMCFNSFLLLYFFWTFPRPFNFLNKRLVKPFIFIIPSLLFIVLFPVTILTFVTKTIEVKTLNQLMMILNIINSVLVIAAWVSLIINYRRLKSKEEKRPVAIILAAFTIGIIAAIYTATIAPAISDFIYNSPEYYTPIILIVLTPLAFAYSIFKYQLMDVSVVVKNTITYGAATITVALVYFLVIYLLGQTISQAIGTQYQGLIAGIIFILFALIFQSTKDNFQDFITARFYPEQFAYQKVLLKFSNDVSIVVGLENILDSMHETYVKALMINKFGILISGNGNGKLKLVRSTGITNKEIEVSNSSIINCINEKNLVSKRPVIEQEDFVNVFPEQASQLTDENVYTIIPMIIKSKVIGLLLFGLKHSGSQFAGKDLDLLLATANQSAISIENARLYHSEAEKIRIENDLKLARKIQQGLLPKCLPDIKKLDISGEMIPAMQVGGDYYDVIPVSDSKLFIVVGDVSGKGLPASLYMTKLQTMVQLSCIDGRNPKEILIDVNRRIYSSIERNSFITMTLALFDMDKMSVRFCRAGHMPILTANNGTVDIYKSQGLGIGLEQGMIFESTLIEQEINLIPGQIYAFYSDGITEAMNENMDLFGEEKLSELLRNKTTCTSSQIMNEIWNSISSFKGKALQNDDMTMVLVKVK